MEVGNSYSALIYHYHRSAMRESIMKITKLKITDFKALRHFEMEDIPDIVVLGGPNGVGKSAVLEAISYLKTNLGPYHGGFSRDKLKQVVTTNAEYAEINATFRLHRDEVEYIQKIQPIPLPLSGDHELSGAVRIFPDGKPQVIKRDDPLPNLLGLYDRHRYPQIGIVEHLDPHRQLPPKAISSLSLKGFDDPEEKQRRIIKTDTKFALTKNYLVQLATADAFSVLSAVQQGEQVSSKGIPDSLLPIKEIFDNLLAPKRLLRVDLVAGQPAQVIVETPNGEVDIDALSSGEKEILAVFTEFHKLKLQNSIVLFDEPDLHLNQEIERRLIEQFRKSGNGTNQFWIATHSLAIMDSVEHDELFRLENYRGENQVVHVFETAEKRRLFRHVAGRTGLVTLGRRIIFVEGDTDLGLLRTLYPNLQGKVTFVPSGGVNPVMGIQRQIVDLLSIASPFTHFFAIRDRDFARAEEIQKWQKDAKEKLFIWSKYHLENFLLDSSAIFGVLQTLLSERNPFSSPKDVEAKLREIAESEQERVVVKWMQYELRRKVCSTVCKSSFNEKVQGTRRTSARRGVVRKLNPSDLEKSAESRLASILSEVEEVKSSLGKLIEDIRSSVEAALAGNEWRDVFPGREILKQFVQKYGQGIAYKHFKNLVANEIQRKGIPEEIQEYLNHIIQYEEEA